VANFAYNQNVMRNGTVDKLIKMDILLNMKILGVILFLSFTQFLFPQNHIIDPEINIYYVNEISRNEEANKLYRDAFIAMHYNDNSDEAIDLLLQALELEKDFFHALGFLGVIYVTLNRNDIVSDIENKFIELIQNDISNKDLYYLLVLIYDEQKAYMKEIDLLKQLF
jgi:tetratricopeptide (TPR) repeat protein